MISMLGLRKARNIVTSGVRGARYEKLRAHRTDRRVNRERLREAVEHELDYEPELVRGDGWNVA
jgi:hypothetical protein